MTDNEIDVIVDYGDIDHTWNQAVTGGVLVNFVYGWNRIGQYYQFTDDFNPGEAYWIYASQPCMQKRNI